MADDEETADETKDESEESGGEATKSESDGEESESGGNEGTAEEAAEQDDPEFGVKDDEPVNDVQMKYLEPLAEEQDEELPDDMSEADATQKINEMQENASG